MGARRVKHPPTGRRSLFEDLDRPALKPLPAERYEYAEWRKARVNIDYHIQADSHLYSVPHALWRLEVEVRLTATTVEVFHKHRRVAAHLRGRRKGGYTTVREHLPAAHRAHLEWTPSRLVRWARREGSGAPRTTLRNTFRSSWSPTAHSPRSSGWRAVAFGVVFPHCLTRAQMGRGRRRLQVLAHLTRLRPACCNPRLVQPNGPPSSKMRIFSTKLEELRRRGDATGRSSFPRTDRRASPQQEGADGSVARGGGRAGGPHGLRPLAVNRRRVASGRRRARHAAPESVDRIDHTSELSIASKLTVHSREGPK